MNKTIDEMRIAEILIGLDCVRPPMREITKLEALQVLRPKLIEMKDRGHTIASICAALASQDLDYSPRQIATAIRVPRVEKAPVKKNGRRTMLATPKEPRSTRDQLDITS